MAVSLRPPRGWTSKEVLAVKGCIVEVQVEALVVRERERQGHETESVPMNQQERNKWTIHSTIHRKGSIQLPAGL